jgi:hypothetical protein
LTIGETLIRIRGFPELPPRRIETFLEFRFTVVYAGITAGAGASWAAIHKAAISQTTVSSAAVQTAIVLPLKFQRESAPGLPALDLFPFLPALGALPARTGVFSAGTLTLNGRGSTLQPGDHLARDRVRFLFVSVSGRS